MGALVSSKRGGRRSTDSRPRPSQRLKQRRRACRPPAKRRTCAPRARASSQRSSSFTQPMNAAGQRVDYDRRATQTYGSTICQMTQVAQQWWSAGDRTKAHNLAYNARQFAPYLENAAVDGRQYAEQAAQWAQQAQAANARLGQIVSALNQLTAGAGSGAGDADMQRARVLADAGVRRQADALGLVNQANGRRQQIASLVQTAGIPTDCLPTPISGWRGWRRRRPPSPTLSSKSTRTETWWSATGRSGRRAMPPCRTRCVAAAASLHLPSTTCSPRPRPSTPSIGPCSPRTRARSNAAPPPGRSRPLLRVEPVAARSLVGPQAVRPAPASVLRDPARAVLLLVPGVARRAEAAEPVLVALTAASPSSASAAADDSLQTRSLHGSHTRGDRVSRHCTGTRFAPASAQEGRAPAHLRGYLTTSNVPLSARRLAEMRGARAQITADPGKRCNPGATQFPGYRTSGQALHHTSMNLAGCWIPLRHACASRQPEPTQRSRPRRRAHAAKRGPPGDTRQP